MLKKGVYDFSSYKILKPSHKKTGSFSINEQQFLEWFIGFCEGDGSFLKKKSFPVFLINQADLPLLRKIRTILGFGHVSTFEQNNATYARYTVSGKENVQRLIAIFNGNIQLTIVHQRFSKWVGLYNTIYCNSKYPDTEPIKVKPCRSATDICLLSSWLSGFFDAEGGFYAGFSSNKAYTHGYQLRLKVYVDKKNEYEVMDRIRELFQVKTIIIRNKEQALYKVEIFSNNSLNLAIDYFQNYKLVGKKHLVYAIWKKVVNMYSSGQHLKLENQSQLKKRVKKIQELNNQFKLDKTVLLQNYDNDTANF